MEQEPAAATLAERDEALDRHSYAETLNDVGRAEQHAAHDATGKDATWLKFTPPRTMLKCQIGDGNTRSCWVTLDVNSSELCCETRSGEEMTIFLSSGAEVTIPSPLEQPLAHCLEVREAPHLTKSASKPSAGACSHAPGHSSLSGTSQSRRSSNKSRLRVGIRCSVTCLKSLSVVALRGTRCCPREKT